MIPADLSTDLYCPECGYNLHGIESLRCPECGSEFDRATLSQSILPWLNRSYIGSIRAFWQTAQMVTLRPKDLAREMARPVQLEDALKFRRIVCVLGMLVLVPTLTVAGGQWILEAGRVLRVGGELFTDDDLLGSFFHGLIILSLWVGAWLFLKGFTGVASYFFHPDSLSVRQQNRAIALSYYACAPIAYAPLVLIFWFAVLIVAQWLIPGRTNVILVGTAMLIAFTPPILCLIAIFRSPIALAGVLTHCGWGKKIVLGIFLPIAWLMLAVLTIVLFPATVAVIGLMVISLRG